MRPLAMTVRAASRASRMRRSPAVGVVSPRASRSSTIARMSSVKGLGRSNREAGISAT